MGKTDEYRRQAEQAREAAARARLPRERERLEECARIWEYRAETEETG